MKTVLAIPVDAKVAPDILEHAGRQDGGAFWREGNLYIHLADLDPLDAVEEDGLLGRAMRKAANAQQGFRVVASGLRFDGRDAYLAIQRKAGMLQSVAESVPKRLPDASMFHFEEPWKPRLPVARFDKEPGNLERLQLEAAWHGKEWEMAVKEIAIAHVDDTSFTPLMACKLTSSGG